MPFNFLSALLRLFEWAMAHVIKITQLSPTMKEGVFVETYKQVGEAISPGIAIAGIETDKAVMDLEAYDEGILLAWVAKTGSQLPVGAPIGIIGDKGEDISELQKELKKKLKTLSSKARDAQSEIKSEVKNNLEKESNKANAFAQSPKKIENDFNSGKGNPSNSKSISAYELAPSEAMLAQNKDSQRIRISPLARNLAKEKGVDITQIKGTGPMGRIVKADIEHAPIFTAPSAGIVRRNDQVIDLSMMRLSIAKNLSESKKNIPHYTLTKKVDVTELMRVRKKINEGYSQTHDDLQKVSLNTFFIKGTALALMSHPQVNAQWNDDSIILKGNIDIAFAVAIDGGLITPTLRNANQKSIMTISKESSELISLAKNRKLSPEQYTNGSFTISNLGMYGIDHFSAIINAPQAGILAIGKNRTEPVYEKEKKEFLPREIVSLTLSSDHRVVDGALGALFLDTLAKYLENPELLISM